MREMPPMTPVQAFEVALRLQSQGRVAEAISICREILGSHPNRVDVLNSLGILHQMAGELGEAREFFLRAIATHPGLPELHYNLANVHRDLGDFDGAISSYRQALALRPDFRPALNNLANALKETGDISGAKALFERTLSLHSDPRIASNLLYLSYFDPEAMPRQIFQKHAEWNQNYAQPFGSLHSSFSNDRSSDRPLRIGYMSPDFRNHPVARFLLPLLAQHNRGGFQAICYSDVRRADSMTQRIAALADGWWDTTRFSDDQLAQLIRQDRIDILVDLTMHMDGNRMLVFARKPAPVQVTYLAYAGTTGLTTMDYRLSDPHLDPPPHGCDEYVYSEKTLRLNSYWCYVPPPEAPAVGPLPALTTGHITFGCLNNFSKINPVVLETWRQLMASVANSRLILSAHLGLHRSRVLEFFGQAGISPDRIKFHGVLPFADYLALYNRIDIALDPFPYPGGTTSFDALYMGVPVITLPGQTAVSRAGVSILEHLGLPEFIARSSMDYIRIASDLATDTSRLSELHKSLRPRLLSSALTDARSFAASVESAFRGAWIECCGTPTR
jgi:predicted O-linked N-acetylglucosamine transferase (SPINDLY family)